MQEVYAALLIHASGGEITEEKIAKVIEASGAKPDMNKIKALVASLEGVNIDEALKEAAIPAAPAAAPEEKKEEKEEKKEEKAAEEAAVGLSALFG